MEMVGRGLEYRVWKGRMKTLKEYASSLTSNYEAYIMMATNSSIWELIDWGNGKHKSRIGFLDDITSGIDTIQSNSFESALSTHRVFHTLPPSGGNKTAQVGHA
jgi:hypothetical protein